jgi:hypothetical protein
MATMAVVAVVGAGGCAGRAPTKFPRRVSAFVDDLCTVWKNVAAVCHKDARLIVRFGAINDRLVDPLEIMKASLKNTPWELVTVVNAGTARGGKRQADSFGYEPTRPIAEYDAWAVRV